MTFSSTSQTAAISTLGILEYSLQVGLALPVDSDYGDAHAVVGAENPFRFGEEADSPRAARPAPVRAVVLIKSRRLISESLVMRCAPPKV